MKTINIDEDVYAELQRHAVGFNDTENDALRRLLKLSTRTTNHLATTKPLTKSALAVFVESQEFSQYHQAIDRYLALLAWAYSSNPQEFIEAAKASATRGTRLYFGRTQKEVESSGQKIVATQVRGSPIWTLTSPLDNSTKRKILGSIFGFMKFGAAGITLVRAQVPDEDIRSLVEQYI